MTTAAPAELPMDIEDACLLIERLEIHRQCLDEALAEAYANLIECLGRRRAADPELLRLLRTRPWLAGGAPWPPTSAVELTAGVSWLAACGSAVREPG